MFKAMTEEELIELKTEIEDKKRELSEKKGQEKALLQQLKEDWKCTTLKEAKEKLEGIAEKLKTILTKIETGMEKLQEKYNL
jgi:hypothetical protein